MRRPMLKRQLNPFLLISIVAVLSLLAALSVVYQGQLNDLLTDNEDLSQELEEEQALVNQLESENTNLTQQLRDAQSDLEQTQQLYENEESRREDLESEVDDLENRVEQLEEYEEQAENLNKSLEATCMDNNNLTDWPQNECEKWGHR